MDFLFLLAGILIGAAVTWLLLKNKTSPRAGADPRVNELDRENATLREKVNSAVDERKKSEEKNRNDHEKLEAELRNERKRAEELSGNLKEKETELREMKKRLDEQKKELEELQQRLKTEFENLANKILEEKTQKFTEQNRTQLDILLKPLGEKIKDFEEKVTKVYNDENKERATLKGEITKLFELNQVMAKEAGNLTRALKGDTKTQGNWGEFILESVLEKSGLRKDHEYRTQQSFAGEEGNHFRPDVIIDLPDEKHLVVDSKVSLVAYERFIAAETEEEKTAALKEHVTSLRRHIKDLSEKKYHDLYQLNSLDFVLLFMPIEPAFAAAVQADSAIFNDAFSKNILIVSPSTLLATLRTVANIWRQEYQNRNAMEIARLGGSLIDKLARFVEDLVAVGKKMDDAKSFYEDAMKKLHSGRGNLISTAEKMKTLGAKSEKELPPTLIERASEHEFPGEK